MEIAVAKGLGRFEPVFSPAQESELVNYLTKVESNLVGLSTEELKQLVVQLADKNNIPHTFNEGRAGKDWIQGFLRRHSSDLSLRKPEATSAMRAESFNQVVVNLFFDLLEKIMNQYNLTPDRIFNIDETSFTCVPKHQPKIFAKNGKKKQKFVFPLMVVIYHLCLYYLVKD
ncbi:uncharacterized protein LOC141532639 [Cotesia typhae]|uniref:uncharacterized protein LOC141532639 n=1 Tax=Cotesia typhae TaxID=2053667 RepID=UPI003D68613A